MFPNSECFSYKGAATIIEVKGLLTEINEVIAGATSLSGKSPTHEKIQGLLKNRGWSLEKNLLTNTDYKQDAFKQGILVEIDLHTSSLDSVHRNFLRAQELYNRKRIDVLVQIVGVKQEPQFSKMKRDICVFKSVLSIPIYLIGLHEG